jgi:hypothetical protein
MSLKNSLKANAVTVQRLREAASKVAPNRGVKPTEVSRNSAGTLLKKSKLAFEEANRLLDH